MYLGRNINRYDSEASGMIPHHKLKDAEYIHTQNVFDNVFYMLKYSAFETYINRTLCQPLTSINCKSHVKKQNTDGKKIKQAELYFP